ncbi:MAG: F0F1 ATP synthase subunit epsilon [Dehalococcoidia bacterium]
MKLNFDIVTAERVVYSDEVDVVVAPGTEGQLAILPNHAPLMTMLQPGEMMVRKDGQESFMFVSGGFMEMMANKVTILADTAERADEIDAARAEEARKRAEQWLESMPADLDSARAEAALRRSVTRLKVAERRRRRRAQTS